MCGGTEGAILPNFENLFLNHENINLRDNTELQLDWQEVVAQQATPTETR
ncbi:hypothetical protein GCM10007276_33780 [Agaricicola taiwanensis]|uniref:Uncharacterized protein n=1 Tax=Agaricicola taiwanensis TaxID=591372 RepID=A0A8J2YMJ2_9RHOB|nr:hypothetical protein [Agaricicola taiwanensis]GGE53925.1 hypothetical protein GCM10007276_33780 [Agaricicola taiwanensis]